MNGIVQADTRRKPGKTCNKCRLRKVKCDQQHPTCLRCIKISHTNCQYPDDSGLILLNETESAAQRAKAKWRSRSKKVSQGSWSPRSSTSITSIVAYPWHSPRAALPYDDMTARQCFVRDWAVCDLFGHWQPANAIAEFLPEMKYRINTQGMLYNAFMAAAFANYAQKKKDRVARQVAMENCALAISSVSQAMQHPSPNQDLDKIVATIALLGMYEILFSGAVTKLGSYNAHLNGTIALIQSRMGDMYSARPTRFGLMNLIWVQMMTHCISHGKHCSLPLELRDSWIHRVQYGWEHWKLMYDATELCARWREVLIGTASIDPVREAHLISLIDEGKAMNQAFDEWHQTLPEEWQYWVLTTSEVDWPEYLEDLANAPDAPSFVYKFNALQFQFRWAIHWTWKLIVNQALLQSEHLLWTWRRQKGMWEDTTLNPSTSASIIALQEEIFVCIDHIRSTALNVFAGHNTADPAGGSVSSFSTFSIIFPLSVAGYCMQQAPLPESEVAGRLAWVKRTLGWIGDEMGFSKAYAMRDFDAKISTLQLWGGVEMNENGFTTTN